MSKRIPCLILLFSAFALPSTAEEEDRINVEIARVKNSRLSKGTAWGYIPYPPDVVFRYILAYDRYAEFMPSIVESRVLERGEGWMEVYQKLNFPWPLANRWYRAKIDIDEGRHTVSWETEDGNIKSCTGGWEVRLIEGGSRVTYSVCLDPGGHYPSWMMNYFQRRSLPAVIRALRQYIEENEGEKKSGSADLYNPLFLSSLDPFYYRLYLPIYRMGVNLMASMM